MKRFAGRRCAGKFYGAHENCHEHPCDKHYDLKFDSRLRRIVCAPEL